MNPRKPIFDAVRVAARPGLFNDKGNILALDNLLDAFNVPRAGQVAKPAPAVTTEPKWVRAGRSKIGEREIPGPKHNPWIIGFWQKLGATWLTTDDATGPWCGGFMAWCLSEANLPYPNNYPAAASFGTWGTPCKAQVGAILVKARKGGNHVGIIVGITADGQFYKVLGGNQNNMVSIIDIPVSEATAIRWPKGAPAPENKPLPVMPRGTVGASEA